MSSQDSQDKAALSLIPTASQDSEDMAAYEDPPVQIDKLWKMRAEELAEIYIKHGARIVGIGPKGELNLLHRVCEISAVHILATLVEDPTVDATWLNKLSGEGRSALSYALAVRKRGEKWPFQNNIEIVQLLIEAKCDLDSTNSKGQTALHEIQHNRGYCYGSEGIYDKITYLLVTNGANILLKDKKGNLALEFCPQHAAIIEEIIQLQKERLECLDQCTRLPEPIKNTIVLFETGDADFETWGEEYQRYAGQ